MGGEQVGVAVHEAALAEGGEYLAGGDVGDFGQGHLFGQGLAAGGDGAGGYQHCLDIVLEAQGGDLAGEVGHYRRVGAGAGAAAGQYIGAGLDYDAPVGRLPSAGGSAGSIGAVRQSGGHFVHRSTGIIRGGAFGLGHSGQGIGGRRIGVDYSTPPHAASAILSPVARRMPLNGG